MAVIITVRCSQIASDLDLESPLSSLLSRPGMTQNLSLLNVGSNPDPDQILGDMRSVTAFVSTFTAKLWRLIASALLTVSHKWRPFYFTVAYSKFVVVFTSWSSLRRLGWCGLIRRGWHSGIYWWHRKQRQRELFQSICI